MRTKVYKKIINFAELDISTNRGLITTPTLLLSGMLIGFSMGNLIGQSNSQQASIITGVFTFLMFIWVTITILYISKAYCFYGHVDYDLPNNKKGGFDIQGIAIKKFNKSVLKNTAELEDKITKLLPKIIEEKISEDEKAETLLAHRFSLTENERVKTWTALSIYFEKEKATSEMAFLLQDIYKKLEEEIPQIKFHEIISTK